MLPMVNTTNWLCQSNQTLKHRVGQVSKIQVKQIMVGETIMAEVEARKYDGTN